MKSADPPGFEPLTITERLVRAFHVQYWVGCLVVALLAGGPGSFTVLYLSSFNLDASVQGMVALSVLSISPVSGRIPLTQGLLETVESTVALFVDMYLIGYLRHQVTAQRGMLSQLSPNGPSGYDRAFGLMSSTSGPLLFALVFVSLYFPARATIASGAYSLIGILVLTAVANVVYGAAFWVYLSGLWGVYKFGAEPLRLKGFLEDRMLGLRPLGQLVVLFALIFTLAITLTLGGSLIAGDAGSIEINLVIVAVGVAMLFLPLANLHRQMLEVKEREETALRARFSDGPKGESASTLPGNQSGLTTKIENLVDLQRLLLLREEVSKISEWPFEARSVERLVAILLALFTVLLTRLVQVG